MLGLLRGLEMMLEQMWCICDVLSEVAKDLQRDVSVRLGLRHAALTTA